MNQISIPAPLPSKVGKTVLFAPPRALPNSQKRKGIIVDEVRVESTDPEWGWYVYLGQLVEFKEGDRQLRICYYHFPPLTAKKLFWKFGQFAPVDKPEVLTRLFKLIVDKGWHDHV